MTVHAIRLGCGKVLFVAQDQAISAVDNTKSGVGGTDSVTVTFNSSGLCTQIGSTNTSGNFTWLLIGASSDYEINVATGTGGPPTTNPGTGTWLNMGTTRTWILETTNDDVEWTTSYSIRRASDGYAVGSGTIHMRCFTAP